LLLNRQMTVIMEITISNRAHTGTEYVRNLWISYFMLAPHRIFANNDPMVPKTIVPNIPITVFVALFAGIITPFSYYRQEFTSILSVF
jgi:hypothetical protein